MSAGATAIMAKEFAGISLAATARQLDIGAGSAVSDSEKEQVRQGFNELQKLNDILPNFTDVVLALRSHSTSFVNMSNGLTDFKRESLYTVNLSQVNVTEWDAVRLFVICLLMLVPFLLISCTMCSCASGHNGPSMFMALVFFGVMVVFFLIAAVQIIPAIVIADNCPIIPEVVKSSLDQYDFSELLSFVDGAGNSTAADLFSYYTECTGSVPSLVSALLNPRELIGLGGGSNSSSSSMFDPTDVVKELQAKGINASERLYNNLDIVNATQNRLLEAAAGLGKKLHCEESMAVWQGVMNAGCVELNGALALSTVLFFFFAVCLFPGTILGIKGYKRFDRAQRGWKVKGEADAGEGESFSTSTGTGSRSSSLGSSYDDSGSYYSDSYSGSGSGSYSGSGSGSESGSGSGSESDSGSYSSSGSRSSSGSSSGSRSSSSSGSRSGSGSSSEDG